MMSSKTWEEPALNYLSWRCHKQIQWLLWIKGDSVGIALEVIGETTWIILKNNKVVRRNLRDHFGDAVVVDLFTDSK